MEPDGDRLARVPARGQRKALEERLAFMVTQSLEDRTTFKKRTGWKDDERKCAECGETREEGPHELDGIVNPDDYHEFVPSKNEVAYLYERLKGLVTVKRKKDCLDLPDRVPQDHCRPTASLLRVAESIAGSAANPMTAATLLRELSDGFQYHNVQDGRTRCTHCVDGTVKCLTRPHRFRAAVRPDRVLDPAVVARLVKETVPCPVCGGTKEVPKIIRVTHEVPCPKEAALRMCLDECEETGRIVIFAGFTGSVDRRCGCASRRSGTSCGATKVPSRYSRTMERGG